MRKIILILLLLPFLFCSCRYFGTVPSEEKLLEKELQSINWKQVDAFPSVSECEKIKDTAIRKHCFFEFLSQTIQDKLKVDSLALLFPQLDTIAVKVTVLPNATLQFEPQFKKESGTYDTLKLDSLFQSRLIDFPPVHPAIKRGIPVKTQFILPIILRQE